MKTAERFASNELEKKIILFISLNTKGATARLEFAATLMLYKSRYRWDGTPDFEEFVQRCVKFTSDPDLISYQLKTFFLSDRLEHVLSGGANVRTFFLRLKRERITPHLRITKAGKVTGISFEYDSIRLSGKNTLGYFSWPNMQKRYGLRYDEIGDKAFFLEMRDRQAA